MEDEPQTPPAPEPPTEAEKTEAEDTSPQDAPAEPSDGPDEDGADEDLADEDRADEDGADVEPEPTSDEVAAPPERAAVSHDLPRTSTTGDDEIDLRSPGDGAVSGAPGDDLDDSAQRHD